MGRKNILKGRIMRKATSIMIVWIIFALLPSIKSIPENPSDDTVLDVKIIDEPYAIVRNVGNADAINVRWEMWLRCPIMLISPPKQTGQFDRIEAGGERIISYEMSNSLIFGFGLLELRARAQADNAEPAEDARPIGILIGSYILILP